MNYEILAYFALFWVKSFFFKGLLLTEIALNFINFSIPFNKLLKDHVEVFAPIKRKKKDKKVIGILLFVNSILCILPWLDGLTNKKDVHGSYRNFKYQCLLKIYMYESIWERKFLL